MGDGSPQPWDSGPQYAFGPSASPWVSGDQCSPERGDHPVAANQPTSFVPAAGVAPGDAQSSPPGGGQGTGPGYQTEAECSLERGMPASQEPAPAPPAAGSGASSFLDGVLKQFLAIVPPEANDRYVPEGGQLRQAPRPSALSAVLIPKLAQARDALLQFVSDPRSALPVEAFGAVTAGPKI